MSSCIWRNLLTEVDCTVIQKGGYGKQRGFGKKVALFVIDMQKDLVGLDKPIKEQITEYPMAAGERAYKSLKQIKKIIIAAKEKKIPVIYTKYKDGEFIPELDEKDADYIVNKECDSAFYGTALQGFLVENNIDTVLVTGAGTSTAARTTAVDAITRMYSLGFVEDALFDRITASHKTACLDVWMKFGDVVEADSVVDYIEKM